MKSVALCGSEMRWPGCEHLSHLEIWGHPIRVGLVESPDTLLDQSDSAQRHKALVEVEAFSCNYRDKALILGYQSICRERSFVCFGCEFVGRILEVGADVEGLIPGDRVIGNGSYPDPAPDGAVGLPTNHASRRRLLLPGSRLLKVPAGMPAAEAACFQVAAQTAYSMVRRLELREGSKVLVTAARSNTSLAALWALSRLPVEVYALTTSEHGQEAWPPLNGLIRVPRGSLLKDHAELTSAGPFDAVIDPYFDLYLHQVLPFLRMGGKYITCGCYRQHNEYAEDPAEAGNLFFVGSQIMTGNRQFLGNCLGTTEDLEQALQDFQAGRYQVVVDSIFSGPQIGDFLQRTYNHPQRFGKVAYVYAE